ncbi:uncharacterized protein LOC115888310 [Sitophilus oryzae]|uniref:Uncharacterized protein LOC115888310 n=1 Tax=Sitophilus oryzae TaxID=7048 RepID=A0A6J2YKP2_SITOR|nr:uncharacterized protein LOC115888310 [Sitophilus oryzae]
MKGKLEKQITNRNEQQGFRRNQSNTDAIFIIKQIKEKAIEFNTPAYICFNDLTQAFDRVRLSDIIIYIPTPGGIRQGDSLSPFLFNLLMDIMIEKVTSMNNGNRMGHNRVSMVCYADDAANIGDRGQYADTAS